MAATQNESPAAFVYDTCQRGAGFSDLAGCAAGPICLWVGPEVYQRATRSISEPTGGSAAGAEVPPDITQLMATLRTQLDSTKRRAENAERDLEIARHPPVSADKTATWLELQFDSSGKPSCTSRPLNDPG